jgi:phage-related baseplate assembly protein
MSTVSTPIDISRIPVPPIIEDVSHAGLLTQFIERFKLYWAEQRAKDPTLPDYDVDVLETDAPRIAGRAWSYLRMLDRQRVNDAIKAVLAPLAKGADLDNVVARANVERLVVVPATVNAPAVMESDESLLRRYLLAFDRPAAGSAAALKFHVYTALPSFGADGDVAIVGHAIHGRRGDTDVVICGPGGRDATDEELALARAAVQNDKVAPEAIAVAVLRAKRRLYSVRLSITVPRGPDMALVVEEVEKRVKARTDERTKIGAEVPEELLSGAAYGPSLIRADREEPTADIPSDPYTVPVCTGIVVTAEVQA